MIRPTVRPSGEVTEWPIVLVSKTSVPARVPRVRIPASPLAFDAISNVIAASRVATPVFRECQPPSHLAGQEQALKAAEKRDVRSRVCPRVQHAWCAAQLVERVANLTKRYAIAAHNLARILRKLFGIGKPQALQGAGGLAALAYLLAVSVVSLSANPSASRVVWSC
jgi:hypothetical protein